MTSKWKAKLGAVLLLVCAGAQADELKFAQFTLTRGEEAGTYALTADLPGRIKPGDSVVLPEKCTKLSTSRQSLSGVSRFSIEFRCSAPFESGDVISAPWGEDGAALTSWLGSAGDRSGPMPGGNEASAGGDGLASSSAAFDSQAVDGSSDSRVRQTSGSGAASSASGASSALGATTTMLHGAGGRVLLPLAEAAVVERSLADVASEYTSLGVVHILEGMDHLAFVLCLCLLTSGTRLLLLVTSFTLGHSFSLALAYLGVVSLPVPPVEAIIALSIAFMAREAFIARRNDDDSIKARLRHVAVVGAFGLLHGLGFASVLDGLGVSPLERTTGLVFFNLGVEIGQLLFVAGVVGLMTLARHISLHAPLRTAALFAVGTLGAFWTLERVSGFLRSSTLLSAALAFVLLPVMASAQSQPFVPETPTVEAGVGAGPHLYVAGPNRLHVVHPDTLKYQGQISTGNYNQLALTQGGNSIFVVSTYYSRGWAGTREDVVQIYDTTTLEQTGEFQIPTKHAMISPKRPMMRLSANERWLFIQNATPATSVTVVDTTKKKVTGEVPAPGCWGIYPAQSESSRFTSICGDGTFATYTLNARGTGAEVSISEKIFDVDADPIFIDATQDGDVLQFVSFNGNVYFVSIAEKTAKLVQRFSFVQGTEGDWRPGGFQLTASVPETGVVYVLMHKKAKDGTHTDPANEVWAVDMKKQAVLSRSTIRPATAITAGVGNAAALFAWTKEPNEVIRYVIDRSAGFTVREDSTIKIDSSTARLEVR
jgi:methylamine dehydrogenase heavy chain